MKENNRSEIQEWNTGIPIGISKKHPTVLHYPRQMRRIGETLDLHFSFDLLLVLTALFYKFPRHELIFFEGNSSLFQDMIDMSRISNILQAVFAVSCCWLVVGKTVVQRILPSRLFRNHLNFQRTIHQWPASWCFLDNSQLTTSTERYTPVN